MKIKNNIATLLVGIALLASCNDYDAPTYTVGEADNAIMLRAGISEGSDGVLTRADGGYDDIDATNHTKHLTFTEGTKAALRIDGDWWKQDAGSATPISQPTTATIGAETATDSKHNGLTMSPQLYWDDYGTADPANAGEGKGRKKGLTIYGAAVDGEETAPTVGSWTAMAWNVGTPETGTLDQTSGWNAVDLLTSNNVRVGGPDDTYKFDEKSSGKLLEFTHAMTKVTVNLTAGAGFASSNFVAAPTVTLLGFNYTGTVDVEAKTSTPTAATTNIQAQLAAGGASSHTARYEALVFPGNLFDDATEIITLSADGNNYSVTAAMLNAAIQNAITNKATTGYKGTDNTLLQAVNYVINITVNKTDIDVEATIKGWEYVSAENETPVINVTNAYGQTGTAFTNSFDFYRSTAVGGSYLSGIAEGNHTVVNYGGDPVAYRMADQMYWPNHSTHYFFRGVWPLVDSQDGGAQQLGPTTEQVKTNSIEVANVAYKQGYYPSDLMIGMPRKADGTPDETCQVDGHDKSSGANGICATEGKIRMNFQYAMSQVAVELTTSDGDDKVVFDDETKVEILSCYETGEIKLSDGSSDFAGKTATNYLMHNLSNTDYDSYHDAIIPQPLIDGSGNATLKFRITVKSNETFDKYETVLGIKDIKVTEGGGGAQSITEWKPGKKYTYTLRITKSGIKVEATLSDWNEVTAGTDIWF